MRKITIHMEEDGVKPKSSGIRNLKSEKAANSTRIFGLAIKLPSFLQFSPLFIADSKTNNCPA